MKTRLLVSAMGLCVGFSCVACQSEDDSESRGVAVSCADGRLVKLVVDKDEAGVMQATREASAGFLLFNGWAFDAPSLRVDGEGNLLDVLAPPSNLGPRVLDVVPIAQNGAYVAGTVPGSPGFLAWVGKVDAGWQLTWERTFDAMPTNQAQLAPLSDGSVVVAGLAGDDVQTQVYWKRIDASGQVQWERTAALDGKANGLFGTAGRFLTVAPNDATRIVVRSGNRVTLLESALDGVTAERELDVKLALWLTDSVALPDGRLAITSNRDSGAVLTMVDADGSVQWERLYGQGQGEEADAVAFDAARGELVLGGSYRGADHGAQRTWIVATDLDGNQTWQLTREPIGVNIDGEVTWVAEGRGPGITDIAPQTDGSFIATGSTTNLSYFVVGSEPCGN